MTKPTPTIKRYEVVACGPIKDCTPVGPGCRNEPVFRPDPVEQTEFRTKKEAEQAIIYLKGRADLIHVEMCTIFYARLRNTIEPDKTKMLLITDEIYWDRKETGWSRLEM